MIQPTIETLELTNTYGKFVLSPLQRGLGQTIGNAFRRMLLGQIPGAAIKAVRVEGVLHEFAPIPGVKEDMNELLLNLRDLAIRVYKDKPPEEEIELLIDVKGKGRITGADIQCPPDVEIINQESYICTVSDARARFYMEMFVGWGTGYVLPEHHEAYKGKIGLIAMGSQFTPVRKANYIVESTRVQQRTDFERLTIEVWTTGAIAPNLAIMQAAELLDGYIRMFFSLSEDGMHLGLDIGEITPEELEGIPDIRVEELEFSQRTFNCLRRANIDSVREIMQYTESELLSMRGLGRKALDEIKEKLQERGFKIRPGKGRVETLEHDDEDEEEE